jgi:hypothetical protein
MSPLVGARPEREPDQMVREGGIEPPRPCGH